MLCLGAGSIPVGSLNPKPNLYFLNYIITSQSSSNGMLCFGAGSIPVGSLNPKPNGEGLVGLTRGIGPTQFLSKLAS